MMSWSRLVTGASLQAAEFVDNGEVPIAFNISGGLHHARASRASGFCYINDPVIVISSLLKKGRRVAYIDIDAHNSLWKIIKKAYVVFVCLLKGFNTQSTNYVQETQHE